MFLILSLFILTLLMLSFERIVLNQSFNFIFCALIMQQISYRLIHFGYMPLIPYMFFLNSYMFFLTVLIHQILLSL